MPRSVRNTVILAKIETTFGVDSAPTGAADAVLAFDPGTPQYSFSDVERNILRGFFGAPAQLAGEATVQLEFGVEMVGSGTAGTAPAWGRLLRGCAMAEVVTAGQRVTYNPVSTALQSLTIYYHADGALHRAFGCMGSAQLQMEDGTIPTFRFTFTGRYGGVVVAANPATTLTAWQTPQVLNTTNSGLLTLGGTYATGAITGGTTFCSRGLNIDLGNSVVYTSMLGPCSGVDINDRATTGSMVLDLDPAQEVAAHAAVLANTLTSVSLSHGSVAGRRVLVHAPSVQRVNPQHQDVDGRLLSSFDLRVLPVTGNDELLIVAQ